MGWTINYRIVAPAALDDADRELIVRIADKWNPKLHEGCEQIRFEHLAKEADAAQYFGCYNAETLAFEPAEIDPSRSYLWGFTKVQYSEAQEQDLCTVVRALQELAGARPNWEFDVSDDYDSLGNDITKVDVDALLAELGDN